MDFDEYIRQGEPQQQESARNWSIATGLQAVDGIKPSAYLFKVAEQNIEGEITLDETRQLVHSYYESRTTRQSASNGEEEADKVSCNIARILASRTFSFTTNGFISIHRRIFEGVFAHAGKIRDYDITKKEWVLEGDTVSYLNYEDILRALDFDLQQERDFHYKGLNPDEVVKHFAKFIAGLWQIHPFREGNTRTTAVFAIQYLRTIGFEVNNETFANNSWYFRNALVRANYKNVRKEIEYTPVYLERFFQNLLNHDTWELRNRYLHIAPTEEWRHQPRNFSMVQEGQPSPATYTYTHHPTDTQVQKGKHPSSEESTQVQEKKHPSSDGSTQVREEKHPSSAKVQRLIEQMGEGFRTMTEMMELCGMKSRKSFRENYIVPALKEGYIEREYPDSPNHPHQRYRLTPKAKHLN